MSNNKQNSGLMKKIGIYSGELFFLAIALFIFFDAYQIVQIRQFGATTEAWISGGLVVYEVDGQRFMHNIVRFEGRISTTVGNVTVYYDPNNPSRVTTGRLPIGWMTLAGLMVLAIIGGNSVSIYKNRQLKKKKEERAGYVLKL